MKKYLNVVRKIHYCQYGKLNNFKTMLKNLYCFISKSSSGNGNIGKHLYEKIKRKIKFYFMQDTIKELFPFIVEKKIILVIIGEIDNDISDYIKNEFDSLVIVINENGNKIARKNLWKYISFENFAYIKNIFFESEKLENIDKTLLITEVKFEFIDIIDVANCFGWKTVFYERDLNVDFKIKKRIEKQVNNIIFNKL